MNEFYIWTKWDQMLLVVVFDNEWSETSSLLSECLFNLGSWTDFQLNFANYSVG